MGRSARTVSTYYSQISMVRTIVQILGAEPLNQKVAAATPMYGAFGAKPNYTPFTAVPNQIPLTENVNPAQMNRYTWYQTHNWSVPYPGDVKVYLPNQVPGAYLPSLDAD